VGEKHPNPRKGSKKKGRLNGRGGNERKRMREIRRKTHDNKKPLSPSEVVTYGKKKRKIT